ncbi:MAG: AraC family transcriptional regulator [Devosia sp.]|uniref:AraC family transcriptional regulator n=1 Tax=Devosia sp. TaxID=1871048 RepID=UPI001A36FCA7|nr:AraC family transcriptional regulator [Devosia sp.]MBL8599596.1 AraC family transcriptional regulator [Devosia sp.]
MAISPDFEVILYGHHESFRWNTHDYPHQLAKWHYHPEYELHLIRETSGRMRIGDYVGPFGPGNLVLTGPYVPHHWVSNTAEGARIPGRDMLIQFNRECAAQLSQYPELARFDRLLQDSRQGVEFIGETARQGAEMLHEMGRTLGIRRLTLFLELAERLARDIGDRRILSEAASSDDPDHQILGRIRNTVSHIHRNYTQELRLNDLAELAHMEPSTFSRVFKKQTGYTFSRFVTRLRIHHACRLLANSDRSITEICYDSGFNNTANFNRQFLSICGETPSRYRDIARDISLNGPASPLRERGVG